MERAVDDRRGAGAAPMTVSKSHVMAPPGLGHVSARRIRAGAVLLAISTVFPLWSIWLGYFAPNATGDPSRVTASALWLFVTLGVSIWLLVQPWRRRVMIFVVIQTTLWYVLLALFIAAGLAGASSDLDVGLSLIALVIGGVGLVMLSPAEAWALVLANILAVVAGMTLLVGLNSTIFGGAHLLGVIGNISRRAYDSYDFRVASLLLLGITMVFAGVLCLTAVRGLARGQRPAWDRVMIGSLLLLLATAPITPLGQQGLLAAAQAWPAAFNIIILVVARHRLEAAAEHDPGSSPPRTSSADPT